MRLPVFARTGRFTRIGSDADDAFYVSVKEQLAPGSTVVFNGFGGDDIPKVKMADLTNLL